MNRLTDKKVLDNFKRIKEINPDYVASTEQLIYEKLGKLEDLEEELGCPLEVFVNINLRKIKFVYDKNGNKFYINEVSQFYQGFHAYRQSGTIQSLEYENLVGKWDNYKKTWWLKKDKSE